MLCYAMLCYAMLCHAMLCYTIIFGRGEYCLALAEGDVVEVVAAGGLRTIYIYIYICIYMYIYIYIYIYTLNRGFGNRGFRVTKNVSPGCDNPGLVIPKQKFQHEPKAHLHDSEDPCSPNPCEGNTGRRLALRPRRRQSGPRRLLPGDARLLGRRTPGVHRAARRA